MVSLNFIDSNHHFRYLPRASGPSILSLVLEAMQSVIVKEVITSTQVTAPLSIHLRHVVNYRRSHSSRLDVL